MKRFRYVDTASAASSLARRHITDFADVRASRRHTRGRGTAAKRNGYRFFAASFRSTSFRLGSRLLQNRTFVALFAAQLISLLGSGATTVGLALFAYRLAGGADATAVMGNALMLRILAFLVFAQPAGVVADRVSRKALLVVSDVLRAGLLLVLPWAKTATHVYLLVFVLNAVTAFFTPAFEASIPSVVAEADLVTALGLSRAAADVEALVAPLLAAAIVSFVGIDWIFRFDGATYLASALLVLGARLPILVHETKPFTLRGVASDLGRGVRIILRESSLRQAIALSVAEATAGAGAIVATVAYVRINLGRGESAVAIVMAATGIGSSIMALVLGRLTGRYERRAGDRTALHGLRHTWGRKALLVGGTALTLALLPVFTTPPLAVIAALWALLGAGQALIAIPSSTLLAEHTTEPERGRAYAAHFALTHAAWLVAYPAIGHAAARWGAPMTLTTAGLICLCVTAVGARLGRVQPSDDHTHA